MKSIFGFSLLVITMGLISSCGTQFKLPNYLENLQDSARLDTFSFPEPIIQKNDILYINIGSDDIDPLALAPYNVSLSGSMSGNNSTLMGYLVNHKGEIEYPRIGVIQTEGLTKSQLAAIIKGKLEKYLQNPVINIRFFNF